MALPLAPPGGNALKFLEPQTHSHQALSAARRRHRSLERPLEPLRGVRDGHVTINARPLRRPPRATVWPQVWLRRNSDRVLASWR